MCNGISQNDQILLLSPNTNFLILFSYCLERFRLILIFVNTENKINLFSSVAINNTIYEEIFPHVVR